MISTWRKSKWTAGRARWFGRPGRGLRCPNRPSPRCRCWIRMFRAIATGSDSSIRQQCEVELAAAGALFFDRSVDVIEVPEMEPLNAGGGRSAMHPLDNQIHRASRRAKQSR